MENNIKSFTMFVRQDDKSREIAERIRYLNSTSEKPMEEKEQGDLIIAIGGDGTFLNSVVSTNFGKDKVYVGIHTGTLGFLQDLSASDVYALIKYLCYEKEISTRKVYVPHIKVELLDGSICEYKAFNEALICGKDYTKIQFTEYVNDELFQEVSGNGIIISSSSGDTAYSMNAGGAIDFSNHSQLVCTLLTPIKNGAYQDFIQNSIICPKIKVEVVQSENLQLIVDGIPRKITPEQIKSIEVSTLEGNSYINKLQIKKHSKVQIVRDKILGYNL